MIIKGLKRRATLAVFLTAFSISLVSGLSFYLASIFTYGIEWSRYLDAPTFFGFMAFAFSLPAAILMVFVEWPKAKKLIRESKGGMWQHCWISVIAASVIPLIIATIGWAADDQQSALGAQKLVGMMSAVPVFMLGGLFSAIIWWVVVIQYGRRIQHNSQSGATSV